MKKFAFILVLICTMAGAAFASFWSMDDYLGGQSRLNYILNRKVEDSGIKRENFFKYGDNGCFIINAYGPSGNPAEYGVVVLNDGTRRFPNLESGKETISKDVKYIRTRAGQTVEIIVSQNASFFMRGADCRLLLIQPDSEVEFNFENGDDIPYEPNARDRRYFQYLLEGVGWRATRKSNGSPGFVLRKGSIKEDKEFRTASTFDEVMSFYSMVPEKLISDSVELRRKLRKDNDTLVKEIVEEYATVSGAFGALAGSTPIWMIPAEFAVDMVKNIIQAQCAYAVACVYNKKPASGTDEFKNDLYILFADKDNLEATLSNIAKKAGGEAAKALPVEIASKEKLLAKIGSSKKFVEAFNKSKITKAVAKKFTAKGLAKVAPAISTLVGAMIDRNATIYFGRQVKKYYISDASTRESAQEKPDVAKTYTVNYNTDGGTPSSIPPLKDIPWDRTYLLPSTTPTKTGYTFAGWNVSVGGSAKNVKANAAYKSLATNEQVSSITLKAQWKPNSVKVTFESNGGSAPNPASKAVTIDSAYGLLPTVTRDGYSFGGWFTDAKSGTLVGISTKVAAKSDHKLYAHWDANTGITVKFDSNGGGAPKPAEKGVQPGSAYGELPTVSRNGYKFDGWYTEANGGTKVEAKTTNTKSSTHTLYAHWTSTQQPAPDNLKWGDLLNVSRPYGSSTGKMQLVEAAHKSISGAVVIPGTYNGNPVEAKNFVDCIQITSVTMLDGAISISSDAFRGCTNLTSVTIPASVNVIGINAFLNCNKLTSVTLRGNKYTSNYNIEFHDDAFPGNLAKVFKAGGAGTYTRQAGSNTWTKRN